MKHRDYEDMIIKAAARALGRSTHAVARRWDRGDKEIVAQLKAYRALLK